MSKKIDEMFAFISTDPEDGSQGIVAELRRSVWTPYVGADMERVDSLMEMAQEIADMEGIKIEVVKFSQHEVIRTIIPKDKE
jgi:hypothetical protein